MSVVPIFQSYKRKNEALGIFEIFLLNRCISDNFTHLKLIEPLKFIKKSMRKNVSVLKSEGCHLTKKISLSMRETL